MPVIKYQEFMPHSVLRDYVKRFWILEKEYTAEDGVEEVTPDACVELILNFGSPYLTKPLISTRTSWDSSSWRIIRWATTGGSHWRCPAMRVARWRCIWHEPR